MKTKQKLKQKVKVVLCKIFWYVFILESLFIIYNIAPKPADPIILISEDFAKITGPSMVQEGQKTQSYKIEVNKNLSQDLKVTLRYDGVAKNGIDFIGPKYVVIKEDELSTEFTIQTIDDALKEGAEDFALKIQTINGPTFMQEYNTTDASGVVYTKIVDEPNPKYADKDTLNVVISGDKEIFENNKESVYTIRLSKKAIEDIDLDLAFSGEAVLGKDFVAPTHVVLLKGQTQTSFTIKTIDNLFKNPPKKLRVSINGLDDIGFEDIRYESALLDISIVDELKPSKSMLLSLEADKKQVEGSSISYKLSSPDTLEDDLHLVFKIIAHDKNSYENKSVVMHKGSKETTFSLPIKDDNIREDKQFIKLELLSLDEGKYESVLLENPSIQTEVYDQKAVVDAQSAHLSFVLDKKSVLEDSKTFDITVQTTQTLQKDLKVYLKYGGTATFGKDYKAPKSIVIKKGEKEAKVSIDLLDDNIRESNETVTLANTKVEGGGLESLLKAKSVIFTIQDERKPLASDSQSTFYTISGKKKIIENQKFSIYKVLLTNKADKDIKFQVHTSGVAQKDIDYKIADTFTIKKGQTSSTTTLEVLNDNIKEGSENMVLDIIPVNQESFEDLRGKNTPFEINLLDDITKNAKNKNAVALTLSTQKKVKEGEALTYILHLSEPALKDMQVSVLIELKNKTKSKEVKKLFIKKGDSEVRFKENILNDNILEHGSYASAKIIKYSDGGYETIQSSKKKIQTKIVDDKGANTSNKALLKFLTQGGTKVLEDEGKKEIEVSISQVLEKDLHLELAYSGSAQNGVDFKGVQQLLMKKGTQTKHFDLEIINDNFLEPKENIRLSVKKISGGGLENIDTTQTLDLTLEDENTSSDIAVLSLSGPKKVSEGKKTSAYTLTLSQVPQSDLLVSLSYKGPSANNKLDNEPFIHMKIKKGSKQAKFFLNTYDDEEIEEHQSMQVSILSIKGGGLESIGINPLKKTIITKITDEVDIANAFKTMVSKQKIIFASASFTLHEKSYSTLDNIALLLKKFKEAKLTVEGYTNSKGPEDKNMFLSQNRAETIKAYLVKKGVDAAHIEAIGYGESRPRVDVNNKNAEVLNRRVEFKVRY